jgi:hypothetical protein
MRMSLIETRLRLALLFRDLAKSLILRVFARITVVPLGSNVKMTLSWGFIPIRRLISAGIVIWPLLVTAASATSLTPYII